MPILPPERLRNDTLYVAQPQKLEIQVPSVGGTRKAATEDYRGGAQRDSSKMNHTAKNNQLSHGAKERRTFENFSSSWSRRTVIYVTHLRN